MTGNTFSGNISSGAAGGAECYGDQYLTLSNNTFSGNKALNGQGGGAYIYNSGNTFATVVGNSFTANSCGGNYGGGALYVQSVSNLITRNTFSLNSSADGGGAIYDTAPVIIMTENLLVNNQQSAGSATGGAIFVNASATLDMVNNTIFGNSSAGGGGGVSFQVSGLVEVLSVFNNIIWGNSITGGSGGDVYIAGTGSQTLFLYNDANDLSGVWTLGAPGIGNINLDPAFFDPIHGDYHFPEAFTTGPYAGSQTPCANAGTTAQNTTPALPLAALALVTAATATDLDGNPRVNTSGYVDIGCYEFNSTAFHPADILGANSISAADFNGDPSLSLNGYATDWLQGLPWPAPTGGWTYPTPNPNPIPADYVTRAGYLLQVGRRRLRPVLQRRQPAANKLEARLRPRFPLRTAYPLRLKKGICVFTTFPNKAAAGLWSAWLLFLLLAWPAAAQPIEPAASYTRTYTNYVPNQPQVTANQPQVTVVVSNAVGVYCFTIEETLPAGARALNVSDGGVYLPDLNVIRWPPYIDTTLTTVTYQLTGLPANYPVNGGAWMDGQWFFSPGVTVIPVLPLAGTPGIPTPLPRMPRRCSPRRAAAPCRQVAA